MNLLKEFKSLKLCHSDISSGYPTFSIALNPLSRYLMHHELMCFVLLSQLHYLNQLSVIFNTQQQLSIIDLEDYLL